MGFTVKKQMTEYMANENLMGASRFVSGEMYLNPSQPREALEHTYLHELVHMVLVAMNEGDLNVNEAFVDMFAGLLHQSMKTSKGAIS